MFGGRRARRSTGSQRETSATHGGEKVASASQGLDYPSFYQIRFLETAISDK